MAKAMRKTAEKKAKAVKGMKRRTMGKKKAAAAEASKAKAMKGMKRPSMAMAMKLRRAPGGGPPEPRFVTIHGRPTRVYGGSSSAYTWVGYSQAEIEEAWGRPPVYHGKAPLGA